MQTIDNQSLSNKPLSARTGTGKLPNITPNYNYNTYSYSERYAHMTKIANYNEMAEATIWKEYEKLRLCLKQLNDEVLYHMERKANQVPTKEIVSKETIDVITLLDEQKRLNSERLGILTTDFYTLDQRLNHLTSRQNILEEIEIENQIVLAKIKQFKIQNKAYRRQQKLNSQNLENGPTLAEKLMIIDHQFGVYQRKAAKRATQLKNVQKKIQQYQQKCNQLQRAIELRLQQFSREENYIQEEINYGRFEQLKQEKQNLGKYQNVYKRNYLMKLKELETMVNSIKKHQQIIYETQVNIVNMRSEVQQISAMIGSARKRNSSSVIHVEAKKQSKENKNKFKNEKSQEIVINKKEELNDKNTEQYQSTHPTVRIGGQSLAH